MRQRLSRRSARQRRDVSSGKDNVWHWPASRFRPERLARQCDERIRRRRHGSMACGRRRADRFSGHRVDRGHRRARREIIGSGERGRFRYRRGGRRHPPTRWNESHPKNERARFFKAWIQACGEYPNENKDGCRISARISRDSTTRGPGRLKYWFPSVKNTFFSLTARKEFQSFRLVSAAISF